MTATTARAEFLKAADRFAAATDAGATALWGEDAADSSQTSALRNEADASAEATRQLGLLSQVRGRDVVELEGLHPDLEGQTIRLPYAGRLGMGATADMLVIRVRLDPNRGLTVVTGEVLLP